jgi:hypothetical protein
MMIAAPDRTEAAEYYFKYIDQVGPGDIRQTLESQLTSALALFRSISDEKSLRRYEPGKWSIRQVVSHINDTERVFAYRALWFARALEGPLPSFDQDVAIASAGADERSWGSHIEEFRAVRSATVTFFRDLPAEFWARGGVASGQHVTVRALAYLSAGHVEHHVAILRDRYI